MDKKLVQIKAILFDFDGVLTLDRTGTLTTCKYISEKTGIDLTKLRNAFKIHNNELTLGTSKYVNIWNSITRELNHDIEFQILEEAFKSTPINFRMVELAKQFKQNGFKIGIITDNKIERMDCLQRMHDFFIDFEDITVSAKIGFDKNSPEIFIHAMKNLNLDAEECIFVDNNKDNLCQPRNLKMKTIFFDDIKNDVQVLKNEILKLIGDN